MQALFSQTLRFTKPDGTSFSDWKKRNLSFYLTEPKARNRGLAFSKNDVLSVSGDAGCINQIEHMGRSYAGVSVKDYHIVQTNDVVYTKSPLKRNPYGIIKTNFGRDGIVSTLYAVYSPTDKADALFIHYYFSLDDNLNRYLRPIVRKGAKNDMKVNNFDVLGDPVHFPSREEQQKIADALSAMDGTIAAVSGQVTQMEAFKSGLLQQMFV
jgi:type I restriction enzyme S subunit